MVLKFFGQNYARYYLDTAQMLAGALTDLQVVRKTGLNLCQLCSFQKPKALLSVWWDHVLRTSLTFWAPDHMSVVSTMYCTSWDVNLCISKLTS